MGNGEWRILKKEANNISHFTVTPLGFCFVSFGLYWLFFRDALWKKGFKVRGTKLASHDVTWFFLF